MRPPIDAELVHAIRVELKRIRFLVMLLKYYCPEVPIKKSYKFFKILFKQLGILRGEHVNAYRKSQSEEEGSAEGERTKKQLKFEKDLIASIPGFLKSMAGSTRKLLRKFESFPVITTQIFARNIIDQLLESLTVYTPKKKLHHNRHLLKGVIYAAEITPTVSLILKRRFSLDLILKLEDAIGDWHDLSILIHKNRKKKILSKKGLQVAKRTRAKKLEIIYDLIERIHSPKPKRGATSSSL